MNGRLRPSGEPPPLPHALDTAALVWAAVFGFWVLPWAWVFATSPPARRIASHRV